MLFGGEDGARRKRLLPPPPLSPERMAVEDECTVEGREVGCGRGWHCWAIQEPPKIRSPLL